MEKGKSLQRTIDMCGTNEQVFCLNQDFDGSE